MNLVCTIYLKTDDQYAIFYFPCLFGIELEFRYVII